MTASAQPVLGYRALRRGRWSNPGGLYLLTTVTHQRERIFAHWQAATVASRIMADPETWSDARLLCWVLMPDHWHGLVELNSQQALSTVMAKAKGRTSRAVNIANNRTGRIWMPGFHDRALRSEESVLAAARYLIANPLRAGLVKRVGDYPYWNACWM